MTFADFAPPPPGEAGFHVLAGRPQGLRRLMVVGGRLLGGDVGPMHVHQGDEVLRVLSGEILIHCGDQRRSCREGDLVVVAPGVAHGFRVVTETVLEVVAEYEIGTLYPVISDGGAVELVEAYRADMPWGRPPGHGQDWTSDEEMRSILDRLAYDV
jgi:quercetin dioxygenase-like cupin family protein